MLYLVLLSPSWEPWLGFAASPASRGQCHTKLMGLGRQPLETGSAAAFGATQYSVAPLT